MGLYDELRCRYPLPVEGANALLYQTKDTGEQYLGLYEIREDGTLWREEYDLEDRSNPDATSFKRLLGCATRVNKRWEFVPMTGEIRFYASKTGNHKDCSWVEFSACFLDGKLRGLRTIADVAPNFATPDRSMRLIVRSGRPDEESPI